MCACACVCGVVQSGGGVVGGTRNGKRVHKKEPALSKQLVLTGASHATSTLLRLSVSEAVSTETSIDGRTDGEIHR